MAVPEKVLLAYPKTSLTPRAVWAPLSLMALAAPLQQSYKPEIVDFRFVADRDYETLIRETLDGDCLCLGISCLTGYQIKDGLRIAALARRMKPDLPIVWGGYHPSILPEQTVAHPLVDYVVRGQGELTFQELLAFFKGEGDLESIAGLTYKKDGQIIANPGRSVVELDNFPPMPYSLVEAERYIDEDDLSHRTMSFVSSLGCPHKCGFCCELAMFNRRWKGLSAERILDDVEKLVETYQLKGIHFVDANFFVNQRRTRKVCEGMIERKLKIPWAASGTAFQLARYSPELWELMRDSGLKRIFVGVESGSSQTLETINKAAGVDDVLKTHELCRQYGINMAFSIMVGFPFETAEDVESTMELVQQLLVPSRNYQDPFVFFLPYPGSELYPEAVKSGFKDPQSLEEWVGFDFATFQGTWVDPKLKDRILQFIRFYFPLIYKEPPNRRKVLPSYWVLFLLRRMAKFRLSHRFYSFPVEWRVFQRVFNVTKG
ncbi:MAG: B12-binding domain-containing radical SAM protein [Thermoleophilia bacterium]